MDDKAWLAEQFEQNRPRLRAMAYRMLGSASEADDALQDAWLRLSGANAGGIENLGGWLTTVVGRVCVDLLRSRTSRREAPFAALVPETIAAYEAASAPEGELLRADAVGAAVLIVLDTLTPPERLAFVLHDMFGVPFDEIAPIVGRSPTAARQMASRARRRVHGATVPDDELVRQRDVVDAFIGAARRGDFTSLIALLDPDVVLRADDIASAYIGSREVRGAAALADVLSRRGRGGGGGGLDRAIVNGAPGAVLAPDGRPRLVVDFVVIDGKIVEIDVITDPARLDQIDLRILRE